MKIFCNTFLYLNTENQELKINLQFHVLSKFQDNMVCLNHTVLVHLSTQTGFLKQMLLYTCKNRHFRNKCDILEEANSSATEQNCVVKKMRTILIGPDLYHNRMSLIIGQKSLLLLVYHIYSKNVSCYRPNSQVYNYQYCDIPYSE